MPFLPSAHRSISSLSSATSQKRKVTTPLIIIVVLLLSIQTASAATPCTHGLYTWSDLKTLNGVGNYGNNRQYYWRTGFSTTWCTFVDDAVSEWVNTTSGVGVTTPISIRHATTKSEAMFEIWNDQLPKGALGYCAHYVQQTEVIITQITQNWYWSRISIDVSQIDATMFGSTPVTNAQKKAWLLMS